MKFLLTPEVSFIKLHSPFLSKPFPHFTAWQYLEEKWTTSPPSGSQRVGVLASHVVTQYRRSNNKQGHRNHTE